MKFISQFLNLPQLETYDYNRNHEKQYSYKIVSEKIIKIIFVHKFFYQSILICVKTL